MVHQYKLNGYNIVLDIASGAVHAVDEVAYDIIALYPDHDSLLFNELVFGNFTIQRKSRRVDRRHFS